MQKSIWNLARWAFGLGGQSPEIHPDWIFAGRDGFLDFWTLAEKAKSPDRAHQSPQKTDFWILVQKSKSPEIQKPRGLLDFWTFGLAFGTFGFLEFSIVDFWTFGLWAAGGGRGEGQKSRFQDSENPGLDFWTSNLPDSEALIEAVVINIRRNTQI